MSFWTRKSVSRREAIRKDRPDTPARKWEQLRASGVIVSVQIAAVFWVLASGILMFRQDVVPYRPGQYTHHDIISRVDFTFMDKEQLAQAQRLARQNAPRVYQAVPDAWKPLEEKLLALPDLVAGSFRDIEALPNGQVLLSSGDQVFLYDAAGTLVREVAELSDYGFGNNVAAAQIAINPDGSVLYVTASAGCDEEPNLLLTISFASGELLSNRPLAMNGPTSLVVGTLVNPANVPAAGTAALAFLAITLAFAAIWLLRR